VADARTAEEDSAAEAVAEAATRYGDLEPEALVRRLEQEMAQAAMELDFERAARVRDELFDVKADLETGRGRRRHGRRASGGRRAPGGSRAPRREGDR
jgi:excinuclease ABC subunit B